MVREVKLPDWHYPNNLTLDDDEWHVINFFTGGNEDQAGLIFMRVDDSDDKTAIVGINPEQAKKMYDYLGDWLSWCYERKLS